MSAVTGERAAAERRTRKGSLWRGTRLFGVFMLVSAIFLSVLLLGPNDETDVGSLLVAVVTLGLVGIGFIAADRAPHRMDADANSLTLRGRRGSRTVKWSDVAGARTNQWRHDAQLEQVDGTLLRLPAGVPSGLVEAWRSELDGAPAAEPTGETRLWEQSPADNGSRSIAFSSVGIFAGGRLIVPDGIGWAVAWSLAWVSALVLVALAAARGDSVRGTRDGLVVQRGLRRKTVRWTDVTGVVPNKDALDTEKALLLRDGTKVVLPGGFPAGTVDRWRVDLMNRES